MPLTINSTVDHFFWAYAPSRDAIRQEIEARLGAPVYGETYEHVENCVDLWLRNWAEFTISEFRNLDRATIVDVGPDYDVILELLIHAYRYDLDPMDLGNFDSIDDYANALVEHYEYIVDSVLSELVFNA